MAPTSGVCPGSGVNFGWVGSVLYMARLRVALSALGRIRGVVFGLCSARNNLPGELERRATCVSLAMKTPCHDKFRAIQDCTDQSTAKGRCAKRFAPASLGQHSASAKSAWNVPIVRGTANAEARSVCWVGQRVGGRVQGNRQASTDALA